MTLMHPCCSQSTKQNQLIKLNNSIWLQIRDYRAGFRMLSEDAVCGHMGTVAALLVVCIRNQRPPLLEWEADVSEEFSWLQQFFPFFMPKLWALPHSISLPPALSLCCIYIHHVLSSSFSSLTHTVPEAILKSAWRQPPSVLLLQAEEVFLWLHHPTVGHRDSPPVWCQWRRERMRKREV